MIRILSTKLIKELDAYTIAHEPVASIDLMERACKAFASWFTTNFDITQTVGVICGTGNNGGDGLGIARMLHEWGYPVKAWIVRGSASESPDFKQNLERAKGKVDIQDITTSPENKLFEREILIDALFGSGLSRAPEGIYAAVIRAVNNVRAIRVAVDIPSGLAADGVSSGDIVRAHYTVSFQLPKLAFMFPSSHPYTGEWITVDIGLSKSFIEKSETIHFFLTRKDARKILRPRSRFDHKGTYGHALIVAGSYGKMGAAVLASRSALRAGAGLVTAHVPAAGYSIIQIAVPEAMASIDCNDREFTQAPLLESYSAVGIGPGLGQSPSTTRAFGELLKKFRKPVVIDADGLNMLAANRGMLDDVPENSILTPHPKEFERLVGPWADDFERLDKQRTLASRLKSIIVLKGAYSSVATAEGKVYFNSTGNPGMATGGTGDALTGILTGLLAQNYTAADAALLGVFLHGLAGDQAALEKGNESLIAGDIVDFMPQAYLKLVAN